MTAFCISIKKKSAWDFQTFGGGGVGVGWVAAAGGAVVLRNPTGTDETFYYGGAGGGASVGLKLPKIGKLQVKVPKVQGKQGFAAAGAPFSFPSGGALYVTDACSGPDLTKSDIQGLCVFVEIGGGLALGASGIAMLLGASPAWLLGLTNPMTFPFTISMMMDSCPGLLLMAGANVGVQAGGGVAGILGALA